MGGFLWVFWWDFLLVGFLLLLFWLFNRFKLTANRMKTAEDKLFLIILFFDFPSLV